MVAKVKISPIIILYIITTNGPVIFRTLQKKILEKWLNKVIIEMVFER